MAKTKRLPGRSKSPLLGWDNFVDALIDSDEYEQAFGDNTVPYQRRRYKDRPFNLVTPRYGDYWRDKLETGRYKWGAIENFLEMARSTPIETVQPVSVNTANIQIPDMTRSVPQNTPVSISTPASFPLR